MSRQQMLIFGCGVVLLLCLAGAFVIERRVTEANRNLFAAQVDANAILVYVTDFRRWPESEHDLRKVAASGAFEWPKDADEVTRRIRIVYNVNLNDVAMASKEKFPYLVPQGPIFVGSFQAKVEAIIIRAKDVTENERK